MNKGTKKKLKIDFNLLLSGTWVLKEKEAELVLFEKKAGEGRILITSPLGVPTPRESRLLDSLMLKSQEADWSKVIEFPSIRQLALEAKFSSRKNYIDLKRALQVLKRTVISFENCFVDTGVLEHFFGQSQIIEIGIIQGFQIYKKGRSNAVKIVFDDNFLALCKYSLGYKLIPYAPIHGLRDTSYALYKWAYRWYDSSNGYGERWIGNKNSLLEWYRNELNSVANYRYPSEIIRRIKSAIKQLNENQEVPFRLALIEANGSYKIELCKKEYVELPDSQESKDNYFDNLPDIIQEALLSLIERDTKVIEPYIILRSLTKKGLEKYLRRLVILEVPPTDWKLIEEVISWEENFKALQEEVLAIKKNILVLDKTKLENKYWLDFFKAFPRLKSLLTPVRIWMANSSSMAK